MKDFDMGKLKLQSDSDNSNANSTDSDCDLLEAEELSRCFPVKAESVFEKKIGQDSYVLHIDGTEKSNPDVIVGLSNFTCEVYTINNQQIAKTFDTKLSSPLIGVKFCPENENLVYIASVTDGVNMWDLRTPKKSAVQFTDTTENDSAKLKPFLCFDVSGNNRLVSAGTELFEGDAFLLFWDVRNTKLLGGYWESHTDDVTQVKFHPEDMNRLISGSTDGLINLYDLSQSCEDDALLDSLNTDSSIDRLKWHYYGNNDVISCITHTNDVQLWKIDGAEPFVQIGREEIAKKNFRKSPDHCYVIDAHSTKNNELFILTGSHFKNGCLRGLSLNKKKRYEFTPFLFTKGNEKQILRSSWYSKNKELLITGGENSVLKGLHLKR